MCHKDISKKGLVFDTRPIWQSQEVPVLVLQSMLAFARKVADIIFEATLSSQTPASFVNTTLLGHAWNIL